MTDAYTPAEQCQLLGIARLTLESITAGSGSPSLNFDLLPPNFREPRACFVTLNYDGELRGCTGTLMARSPLAEEVVYTTIQTALYDPRFPAVVAEEVATIHIEISVLTPPSPLAFTRPDEIPFLLQPGVHGVTLMLGRHRSTFLPQVWERLSDPIDFLMRLSLKMGLPSNAWLDAQIQVETYQTVILAEPALA
jgi:uncharacterized protein